MPKQSLVQLSITTTLLAVGIYPHTTCWSLLIHAVGADAKNYQAFYKRATAYLALGRTKQAVKDLDVVLNFDPAFDQARKRRAELHAKHGKFDSAKEDYKTLVRHVAHHPLINGLTPCQQGQEQYADKLQAIEQAVAHAHAAREALKKQGLRKPSHTSVKLSRCEGGGLAQSGAHGVGSRDWTRDVLRTDIFCRVDRWIGR